MSRYCLRFTRPLEHEELREDSDGFKPDGEWPENLRDDKLVVEDERENEAGTKEVFDFEGVDGRVMGWSVGIGIRGLMSEWCKWSGWPVLELHKVEDVDATPNEEELHNGIVQRHKTEEEVKVTRDKDSHVESLCFEWYAWIEMQ